MNLYQPVLFVGLGGTGCDIGAVLERRLRDEICGPDGLDFAQRRQNAQAPLLPYQLPSCVQFVYVDMNQAELDRMPHRVVPAGQHIPAAQQTAHYVRGLTSLGGDEDSYPHLALSLRLAAGAETAAWLPPAAGEPKIAPLAKGAGQLPTIGRAALFGSLLTGLNPAIEDLRRAVGILGKAGADLHALGGPPVSAVDVFVAFSVAGGTGAGIFYDYLHLIGHVCAMSKLPAKIYPLVVMPSAFEEDNGGGRPAELNAGRALLDLFRLVDRQNAGDVDADLRGHHDRDPDRPEGHGVLYPSAGPITLRPSTVQTGFLFTLPAGLNRDDLHRSIASLVLSLVGTELAADGDNHDGAHYQSFADEWINQGIHRQTPADSGIGNRGVSTALVASLTVPVDELAGLIGGRLLRTAIEQLSAPARENESNSGHVRDFLNAANVYPVIARQGGEFAEPEPAQGAHQVAAALHVRGESMRAGLAELQRRLVREVQELADRFDPRTGLRDRLSTVDVFRAERVLSGQDGLADEVSRIGAAGLLRARRADPSPPRDGWGAAPPPVSELRDRLAGLKKVNWADPGPAAIRAEQNEWYTWRTQVAWAKMWDDHAPQWQRTLKDAADELKRLTDGLRTFARTDREQFSKRAADLYSHRGAVSYLLPPGGDHMDAFYQQVRRRMIDDLVSRGRLKPAATEADLVKRLVGGDGWSQAYQASLGESVAQAVNGLRDQIKAIVKAYLRASAPGQPPLLPRLHDLLAAAAAGQEAGASAPEDYVQRFRGEVNGLVPRTFTPQGRGPMKVLVFYPADDKSPAIEAYLRKAINPGQGIAYAMRSTSAESISVALLRTSMGVTEVDEVRTVLQLWARALTEREATDFLRWRQRTGYEFGYLATTEDHRVEILHRLLCALWNGKAHEVGDEKSPERLRVELAGGVTMNLKLTAFGHASSWADLLLAYEMWCLTDNDIHRQFSRQLMRELPDGLTGGYREPSPLFVTLCDLAPDQTRCLDDMLGSLPERNQSRARQLRQFWAETLPAALDREFIDAPAQTSPNLRGLREAVKEAAADSSQRQAGG